MKLTKAIQYALTKGKTPSERVENALNALRAKAPEFEYLQAVLPGGIEAVSGKKPEKSGSQLRVEVSSGITLEALSAKKDAFSELHKTVLQEAAEALRPALRAQYAPGTGTAALHGASSPFTLREAAVTPIYQTTAYEFESVGQLEEFLGNQEAGYIYSRWGNPTVTEAQDRLASIAGAEAALLFSSGMGAISSTLLTLLNSGDKMVAIRHLYGGTVSLLTKVLPRMGIEVELIDLSDVENLDEKLKGAKVFYFESMSNPTLRVPDIEKIVESCKKAGVTSVCDNTFATPCNIRTLEYEVDVEIHSGSKYLSGHTDLITGAACASKEIISKINLTMRYTGTNAGPFEAYLLSRGLRTLPLRMERHNVNAMNLALRLQDMPGVLDVWYPGLPEHPDRANMRIFSGEGGMLTFEVEGGLARAKEIAEKLRMARSLTTLGSPETIFCIPVLSSHCGLEPEMLRLAGVTEGMIRVSVGLEELGAIISDFEQALGQES